jgi:stage III sporulation protein AB
MGVIFKLAGMCLVMAGSWLAGQWRISLYRKRIGELDALRQALTRLLGEMTYGYVPLQEALDNIASGCGDSAVADFLGNVSDRLRESPELPVQVLWNDSLGEWGASSCLEAPDLAVVKGVGDVLGSSDLSLQVRLVNRGIDELEGLLVLAREEVHGKSRLARTLSLSVGALLCIILV